MPVQPKQLFQAAIGTTLSTVYTAPDSPGYAELLHLTFCMTVTGPVKVRLHIVPSAGAAGTGNAVVYDWKLEIQGLPYTVRLGQVIPAGATVQVQADATGVTVAGSGLEVT